MRYARREGVCDADTPMVESRIAGLGFFRQHDPTLHLATGKNPELLRLVSSHQAVLRVRTPIHHAHLFAGEDSGGSLRTY